MLLNVIVLDTVSDDSKTVGFVALEFPSNVIDPSPDTEYTIL